VLRPDVVGVVPGLDDDSLQFADPEDVLISEETAETPSAPETG
jgi:hypothetical protein